jgi:LmbE family N-acetylglucosaminyl deacetylase
MKKVVILGCHCDDIELGCGGTLHKHKNNWDITCFVLSKHGNEKQLKNLYKTSKKSLQLLGMNKIKHFNFPINNFHKHRQDIWETLNCINEKLKPDLVITQNPDEHQDHATLFNETIRNFRKSSIVTYNSSIRNCMNFSHCIFETIKQKDVDAKIKSLKLYKMYKDKIYFHPKNIESMLRVQGIYIEEEFSEIFYSVKTIGIR